MLPELFAALAAIGVPGPDTVAVIANRNVPESVALAERYARVRSVPKEQVCTLDLPAGPDIALAELRAKLLGPLEACLSGAGAPERIEALLLVRGVPMRVNVPGGRVSLAAALATGRSEMVANGAPLLGQPPGRNVACGPMQTCLAAAFENPYRRGPFRPGWETTTGGVVWRPLLVTMLHGRTYADAAKLVASATTGEARGGAPGRFLLMAGADPARGALDGEYSSLVFGLRLRGFDDFEQVPFDANLAGRRIAAFFTGTAALGATIEGNTFEPGALVDNLTSFGAVPENFAEQGESQVSIARWVAKGAAGVHGTTDEPLNNCFPSRLLLLEYLEGATLAEAFHASLPFAYWQNLVLGDPMAAPYASRPVVTIEGGARGDRVRVSVEDTSGRGVASTALFANGRLVASAEGAGVEACVRVPGSGEVRLLAVAQSAADGTLEGSHQPKGWATATYVEAAGWPRDCSAPAAAVDAGTAVDGGMAVEPAPAASSCACAGAPAGVGVSALLLALPLLLRRRRR